MDKIDIIVTRHSALIDFLATFDWPESILPDDILVIPHAAEDNVRGKHVLGNLPLRLACLASRVTELGFNIPSELRGQELSLEQLERLFTGMHSYRVQKILFQGPIDAVVSRHKALRDVLISFGLCWVDTPRISHATQGDVHDKRIAGVLPLRLACLARSISEITLDIPRELLGTELDETQIRLFMTGISTYAVERLSS